jgi:hypothetical protein
MDTEWSDFAELPDEARVWVYGFENDLNTNARNTVSEALRRFIPTWTSHQHHVTAAFAVVLNRFAIVAAFTPHGISGCSIDSLWQNLRTLEMDHGLNPLDGGLLFFRDGSGQLRAVDRSQFQQLIGAGEIKGATPVFDTLVESVGQLRAGRFERAFESCWHIRMFGSDLEPAAKATD